MNMPERTYNLRMIGALLVLTATICDASGSDHDSLKIYQDRFDQYFQNMQSLEQEHKKLTGLIKELDVQIQQIESLSSPSWLAKRKLARLTAQKARNSKQLLSLFDHLVVVKRDTDQAFHQFYTYLSHTVDKGIKTLNYEKNPASRRQALQELLETLETRERLLTSWSAFTGIPDDILPARENLVAVVKNSSLNNSVKDDVLNLLHEKITQIDQLMRVAQTESQLRRRLMRFSTEIATLTGDVNLQTTGGTITNAGKSPATDVWSNFTNRTPEALNTVAYKNFNNILPGSQTKPQYAELDYIALIQKIPTDDLPRYVAELEKIRRYYIAQEEQLKNLR